LSRESALAGDDAAVPAALAHHWYAALDLPRALPASIAAARHALTSFAAAEAQGHLERAMEIWPRVPDADKRAGMDQSEVASLAGEAAYWAGNIDRSLALLDQALAGLPDEADPVRRALLLERRAEALQDSGPEAEAIAVLEQALALLPSDQVTPAHAIVLSSLAAAVTRTFDMVPARDLAAQAVQAARQAGAAQQEADSSVTSGTARCYLSGGAEGLEDLRAGLALAIQIGAQASAVRGYVNLSDALELAGRHDEAAQMARDGIGLADRVGMSRTWGAFVTGNLAESLIRMGHWDEAEQLVARALNAMPEGVPAIGLLTWRAEVRYWDVHNFSDEPRTWDYHDRHLAVMGVELRTDRGPSCVLWTDTFIPFGVEVFQTPMSEHLVLGDEGPESWDVSQYDRWRNRLNSPVADVQTFWEHFTIGPAQSNTPSLAR
jgi:tetratricopeptide (TPR) repeat protein